MTVVDRDALQLAATPTLAASLPTLPEDVLLIVARHLGPSSLAVLGASCRALHAFVEHQAWRAYVRARPRPNLLCPPSWSSRKNQSWSSIARNITLVDLAWSTRSLRASQALLPPPSSSTSSEARRGDRQHHHTGWQDWRALPLLRLGRNRLILASHSDLRVWSADALHRSSEQDRGLRIEDSALHRVGPAGLASNAWNDISAFALLDSGGSHIALGRANGRLEYAELVPGSKARQERLRPISWARDPAGSAIQAMHSDGSGLVATAAKRGCAALFRHRLADDGVDISAAPWTPIVEWQAEARPWSILLGGGKQAGESAGWAAVGTTGKEPLHLYPLDESGRPPGSPISLLGSGRPTSVFALSTPPPNSPLSPSLLFAGFYDGAVRAYDLRLPSTKAQLSACLNVSEKLDASPVYSLALGGGGGTHVLAGTARHGLLKIWDMRRSSASSDLIVAAQDDGKTASEDDDRGWSLFAAHPAESPTYAVVADHSRVWGTTDRKVWQLDFSPRSATATLESTTASSPSLDAGGQVGYPRGPARFRKGLKELRSDAGYASELGRLAFYRHSDMVLDTTGRMEALRSIAG